MHLSFLLLHDVSARFSCKMNKLQLMVLQIAICRDFAKFLNFLTTYLCVISSVLHQDQLINMSPVNAFVFSVSSNLIPTLHDGIQIHLTSKALLLVTKTMMSLQQPLKITSTFASTYA